MLTGSHNSVMLMGATDAMEDKMARLMKMEARMWSALASQAKDLVANDNRSNERRMLDARLMQRWAEDRAEWSDLALEAAARAQNELWSLRLRSV